MTEIIGHDDDQPSRHPGPDFHDLDRSSEHRTELDADLDADLDGDLDEDDEDDPDGTEQAPPGVLAAFLEAPTLAVLAALSLIASVTIGPSRQFFAYPFSLGVTSLDGSLSAQHPLRDYLAAVSVSATFAVVGLVAGLTALRRGRPEQPSWVRALAAGAAAACIVAVLLVALGAYRTGDQQLIIETPVSSSAG